jgi:hypothetical protein
MLSLAISYRATLVEKTPIARDSLFLSCIEFDDKVL